MKKRWMVLILSIVMLLNTVFAGTVCAEEPEKTGETVNNLQNEDKCKVMIQYTSIGESMFYKYDTVHETIIEYVEPGTTYGEIINKAKEKKAPKACEGLTFQEWVYEGGKAETDTVVSGDRIYITAEYDKVVAVCSYSYREDGGYAGEMRHLIVDKSMTCDQVMNELSNYSVKGEVFEGLTITSWNYHWIENPTVTVGEKAPHGICMFRAEAVYDKGIISLDYLMRDEAGKGKRVMKAIVVDKNITNAQALELCKAQEPAAEYTVMQREGWSYSSYSYLEEQGNEKFFHNNSWEGYIQTQEIYEGYSMVEFRYYTLDEDGDGGPMGTIEFRWYPDNTIYGEAVQDGKNTSVKVEFEGLDFKGWEVDYLGADANQTVDKIGVTWTNYRPILGNTLVRYYIKCDSAVEGWWMEVLVKTAIINNDAEIPFPSDIGEYRNILWDTENITGENGIIDITGESNVLDSSNVSECDELLQKINESQDGESIETAMETTVLPKTVLDALAGKDVELKLAMQDGLEWKINGKDVADTNVTDNIDLGVIKTEKTDGNISGEFMNEIAGSRDANQLILAHEGEFPFDAVLGVGVDGKLNGKKGVLLWHNNGVMENVDTAPVEENRIDLHFRHASDYALIYALNGDINNDERISMVDLMHILHHVSGRTMLEALQEGIADVDYNNKISMVDLMMVLHYVSGRNSSL